MTEQEAIKDLADYNSSKYVIGKLPYELDERTTIMSIKSLKKQIPMEYHHTRVCCVEDKVRESVCPNCLLVIITEEQTYPKFCRWCGQRILWEKL